MNLTGSTTANASAGLTDTVCGREKRCVCEFGKGATGKRCADDKMHKCESCDPPYILQNRKCVRVDIPQPETTTKRPQPPEVPVYSILGLLLLILLIIALVIVDYFLHERECKWLTRCFGRLELICEPKSSNHRKYSPLKNE